MNTDLPVKELRHSNSVRAVSILLDLTSARMLLTKQRLSAKGNATAAEALARCSCGGLRPYSIAVAPDSSFKKVRSEFHMCISPSSEWPEPLMTCLKHPFKRNPIFSMRPSGFRADAVLHPILTARCLLLSRSSGSLPASMESGRSIFLSRKSKKSPRGGARANPMLSGQTGFVHLDIRSMRPRSISFRPFSRKNCFSYGQVPSWLVRNRAFET